jgi:hypothetical protein
MKKIFFLSLLAGLLSVLSSCEKTGQDDLGGTSCDLPHNAAPAGLRGGWANGFTNFTQIIDAYNGDILGHTWSSAKYFSFTPDGKSAEFYYMANGQYSQSATKAVGTVAFDEGSTAESGSFTFYACKARFKGWGTTSVDRDATDEELQNNLTRRYFYIMDGDWLRIEPGGYPNQFTSSFRKVD